MTKAPEPRDARDRGAVAASKPPENAIAVVSAYGAFRLLLILLTVWTVFAGFSLLTQGIGALTFGADDSATERIAGAYMLILAPIYVLLAWRRDEYRLLIWVPFAAQLAVIVPVTWGIVSRDGDSDDGALMLLVAIIFLVMLVYVRWSSRPAHFFGGDDEEEEYEEDDEEEEEEEEDDGEDEEETAAEAARRRRYRRT
ncbi:MAG TPA: hypothetical protein VIH21_01365 [Dehalococcoidia bacterium]